MIGNTMKQPVAEFFVDWLLDLYPPPALAGWALFANSQIRLYI